MILQSLAAHYEELARQEKVPRRGWCRAKVSCALDIDSEGKVRGIISLKQEEERGKKKIWISPLIEVPEMVLRASGVSANFLCDNAKYLLGIEKEGAGKRTIKCFEAAKKRHLELLEPVNTAAADAVKKFFCTWDPQKAKENPYISERWEEITGGNLIFYTGKCYAQEDEQIQIMWDDNVQRGQGGEEGICLVTGEKTEISQIHGTIKGVYGAQSVGAALVSFNAPAFESFEKEQSYNAPVGRYAVFAYTTALNYLLSQRDFVFRIGETTVVFWAEDGEELYQRAFSDFMEPCEDNQEVIRGVFEKLQDGQPIDIDGIDINPEQSFYILGLGPNAARLSVRFFYRDSFGNLLKNINSHYSRIKIVKPSKDTQEYLGIGRLVREIVNLKSKDSKPQPGMATSLFRSILSGSRYPESLYSNVLMRIRAEQGTVTRGRAAIVKAHLIRNYNYEWIKEDTFVSLNEECRNIAYILGREFAVLEAIQEEANPGINATIKDRYFNSACATPASVFPVLFKLKESHMRKLQNDKKGVKIHYEKLLTRLQGMIEIKDDKPGCPRRLSLEEQGMFILGYYHQVQKRFEKKEEA